MRKSIGWPFLEMISSGWAIFLWTFSAKLNKDFFDSKLTKGILSNKLLFASFLYSDFKLSGSFSIKASYSSYKKASLISNDSWMKFTILVCNYIDKSFSIDICLKVFRSFFFYISLLRSSLKIDPTVLMLYANVIQLNVSININIRASL